MKRLCKAGTDHRKFMRMLVVYVDITAPLYWWKEFDTYKVGTVANSCSTMHCIHKKEFTLDDFSREHLDDAGLYFLETIIDTLNSTRLTYLEGGSNWIGDRRKSSESEDPNEYARSQIYKPKDKRAWWQMIQLLPSSYNQKRTVMLNYEVLANIYKSRKDHKLTEWSEGFIEWIKTLPYSELIKGENYED